MVHDSGIREKPVLDTYVSCEFFQSSSEVAVAVPPVHFRFAVLPFLYLCKKQVINTSWVYSRSCMTSALNQFRGRAISKRLSHCAVAAVSLLSTSRSFCSAYIPPQRTSAQYCASRLFSNMATVASGLSLAQFLCLDDNYGYLLHDEATGQTAAVDTPCGKTYQSELDRRGWKLTHILNTHHHWDHTGGNIELKKDGVVVIGPVNEKAKIPGIDMPVGEGDSFKFGDSEVKVLDAGGHTKGHISFYFPDRSKIFVGDCLFSLGCGKMFEGTPTQFWSSLSKLRDLPDDTLVYWYVHS